MIDYLAASVNAFAASELSAQRLSVPEVFSEHIAQKSGIALLQSLAAFALLKELCLKHGISIDKLYYSAAGQPRLPDAFISIAHSGEYVAAAVSDKPVGIDIEVCRRIKKRSKYKLFTDYESSYVNASLQDFSNRFLLCWTRKEAYVKLNGITLADAASFNTLEDNGKIKLLTEQTDKLTLSVCYTDNI